MLAQNSNICTRKITVDRTLARGALQDVQREVHRRLGLFPEGGLFLGPTHAVQAGSPLESTLAMYRAAGSLAEEIDESILSVEADEGTVDEVDMSKLF